MKENGINLKEFEEENIDVSKIVGSAYIDSILNQEPMYNEEGCPMNVSANQELINKMKDYPKVNFINGKEMK